MDNIKDKIKKMLVSRLKLKLSPDEIKDDTQLFAQEGQEKGLGLDSFDALELVVGLQKEFGIVITDKAIAEKVLISINTIADFIKEKEASS